MKKSLTDKDGEVRELTAADMKHFRPIQETDPGMLEAVTNYRKRGRPATENPKMRVGFRLAADVVEGVRATGPGYNVRVENALRAMLAADKAAIEGMSAQAVKRDVVSEIVQTADVRRPAKSAKTSSATSKKKRVPRKIA